MKVKATVKSPQSMQSVLCSTIHTAEKLLGTRFDQDPVEFSAWATGIMFSPHSRSLANDSVDKEVGVVISLKRAFIFPLGNSMSDNDKQIVRKCVDLLVESVRSRQVDFKNAYIKERFDNAVRDFYQLPA